MERKKVILIGFITVFTLFLLIWGVNFLKGINIFHKDKFYYTTYNVIDGLKIGGPVTYKGYKIGQIKRIEFSDDIGSEIIVTFIISKDFKIPIDSKAEIYSVDLLGSKGIRIVSSEKTTFHNPGDTIISTVSIGMLDEITGQLDPLKEKTEKLMTSIDSLAVVINQLVLKNEELISSSISNINAMTKNFNAVSIELNKMITSPTGKVNIILSDLQIISTTLKNNEKNLDRAIKNFANISDSLASADLAFTIAKTNEVLTNLNDITFKINSGQGTIGQLLNNDTLYNNIELLTDKLNLLIDDIKDNPKKYFKLSVIDMSKTTNN